MNQHENGRHHHIPAIVPACNLETSTAFYRRFGLEVVSDHGD